MKVYNINTHEVLYDTESVATHRLMLVVVPVDEFEFVAGQVDNWALIGEDGDFDTLSGRMKILEESWSSLTD